MACRKMNEDVAYARNTESGCKKILMRVYGTVDDGGNYVTISRFAKLNVRIKIFFKKIITPHNESLGRLCVTPSVIESDLAKS